MTRLIRRSIRPNTKISISRSPNDAAYPPEYPPEYEDQYQPQPEDPQKGTGKKTKRIILFSAIGASVLAVVLVLLFAVILPAVNRSNPTDISRYYTLKFAGVDEGVPEQSLSDGKISCWFAWDYQQLRQNQRLVCLGLSAVCS